MLGDIFFGSGNVRALIFRHMVVEEKGMTLKAIRSFNLIRASSDRSSKLGLVFAGLV
jgi:hypothetical protein